MIRNNDEGWWTTWKITENPFIFSLGIFFLACMCVYNACIVHGTSQRLKFRYTFYSSSTHPSFFLIRDGIVIITWHDLWLDTTFEHNFFLFHPRKKNTHNNTAAIPIIFFLVAVALGSSSAHAVGRSVAVVKRRNGIINTCILYVEQNSFYSLNWMYLSSYI